jgi:serine/threonine protein kinase
VTENAGAEEQVTVGGPVLPPARWDGPLYVGPPDDPDRYELQDAGTSGGEGRTWRATYRGGLNHPLVEAVKMLFPPQGQSAIWPSEADLRRWHDNAALLRHLAQPHVVQLHDIFGGDVPHPKGAADSGRSVAYLSMEWVEGLTLAAHVRGTPVVAATLAERLEYIEHVATAVASLHSHTRSAGNPVLHRDLTPANCIVHATRGIVLIDISGMRLVDDGFDPLGRHTPGYAAPEVLQAPNQPRHPSSDLYAVGAVAVFVLTGQDPDVDPAQRAVLFERLSTLLQDAGAHASAAAAEHLLGLLHPDPAQRPIDVLAWSRTLSALCAQPETTGPSVTGGAPGPSSDVVPESARTRIPRTRRPVLAGAAGVVAAGLAAAGGVYALQHNDGSSPPARSLKAASTPTSSPSPANTSTSDTLAPVREASQGFSPIDFYSTSGRITSLSTGQRVRDCEAITGTAAKLPPGQTLVVSQHNLQGIYNIRFLQVTYDFKEPEKLTTWRTAHYFNPESVGQELLLELIQMPLTPALAKADNDHKYDVGSALAAKGKVIAAVTVVHEDKHNPNYPCGEPE